jgi:hypothetical protein
MTTMKCYFYPLALTSDSKLTDGDNSRPFEINGPTRLVWFDLNPGRFIHPTAYLLICPAHPGIQVKEGQDSPVLDGKRIWDPNRPAEPSSLNCYFYPDDLTNGDVLYDGEKGPPLDITGRTRLVWVDLRPGEEFFPHPTAYVFISAAGVQVKLGCERPSLNGNIILYGISEPVTMELPLAVDVPMPDK